MPQLFVYDHASGEVKGPYRLAQLQALIDSGAVQPQTPVCRAGDTEWSSLREFGAKHQLTLPQPVKYGFAKRRPSAVTVADAARDAIEIKDLLAVADGGGPPPPRVPSEGELRAIQARPTRWGDWLRCVLWGAAAALLAGAAMAWLGALGQVGQAFLAVLFLAWTGGSAWIVFGLSTR